MTNLASITNIETIQRIQREAISAENYELAAQCKDRAAELVAIASKPSNNAVDAAIERVAQVYGPKQVVSHQVVSPYTSDSQHHAVYVKANEESEWVESPTTVKSGYVAHDSVAMWQMTLSKLGERFNLDDCSITVENQLGGLREKITIVGKHDIAIGNRDSVRKRIELSSGHGGIASNEGGYGQQVFRCSNGMVIRSGKLACSFKAKHTKNMEYNVRTLVAKFVESIDGYQDQLRHFRRMADMTCNHHAIIAKLCKLDESDYLVANEWTIRGNNTRRINIANGILRRLRTESESNPEYVNNWRVLQAIHGYYQHDVTTRGNAASDDRAEYASTKPEFSQALQLLS